MIKRLQSYTPEYLLCMAVFVTIFGLFSLACIARFAGLTYLEADVNIYIPSAFWQIAVMAVLKTIDYIFLCKLLCNKPWHICILFACAIVVISGFLAPPAMIAFEIISLITLSALCDINHIDKAAVKAIVIILIVFIYGALVATSRVDDVRNAKFTYQYIVVLAIDYKLLPLNLWLFNNVRRCKKYV